MTLYTKCILAPSLDADGLRISVMSRHTLSDGVTPDPRITEQCYAQWRRELAPPPFLVGAFCRGEVGWAEFERSYYPYIRSLERRGAVRRLAREALICDITIMCVEDAPTYCHRRLLALECQRVEPSLVIKVR
jgi:uncharacterized protein YeaO (DUF488 family)